LYQLSIQQLMKYCLFSSLLFFCTFIYGQDRAGDSPVATTPPVSFTSEQDQKNMMEQLGIRALRPGPSGNESAANHANYDEAKANPYPHLPDALTLKNGKSVVTPELWWKQRRGEIAGDFEREVYGRIPKNVPSVTWSVVVSEREYVGWTPVIARQLIGHVDNSAYPLIDVNISMTIVTPADAKSPVPVLMMFGTSTLPSPVQPNLQDFEKLNAALKALLAKDPAMKEILDKYPAYSPLVRPQGIGPAGYPLPQNVATEIPSTHQLIAAGWGYCLIDPGTIQADNGAGLTRGIIGLVNKGQPREPEDWGALRAWSWGAARALDYLETDPTIDAKHVGIEGVSRYGKAALVTLAFETRFAFGLIGSSGKGGTTLHRRVFGEAVENLTGGGYYWMAGNYLKYGSAEGKYAGMTASDLPVDSHELIALCAPRPIFISYGVPERGDARWLDHQGSYMAAIAAGPVYKLLGAKDLGLSNDYEREKMPPVNAGMLDGEIAWRQHDGGHTDNPNIKYFLEWASRYVKKL
jgi:hypothetical protein